jgi:hypothetical protein
MLEGGVPYPVVASIMDWSEVSARKELAPQVGLEPTTLRLTAECSAIELLRSGQTGRQRGGRPLDLSS